MADHLDVVPKVLEHISRTFDDRSQTVEGLTLPSDVDGGRASADILLLLSEVSADLSSMSGGMFAMSAQLSESRRLYIETDVEAAEAIFLTGGGR